MNASKFNQDEEQSPMHVRKIRFALVQQGISLTDLANKAGMKLAHVSQIASGAIANPGVYTLKPIADALGVSLSWLAGDDVDEVESLSDLRGFLYKNFGRNVEDAEILKLVRNVMERLIIGAVVDKEDNTEEDPAATRSNVISRIFLLDQVLEESGPHKDPHLAQLEERWKKLTKNQRLMILSLVKDIAKLGV